MGQVRRRLRKEGERGEVAVRGLKGDERLEGGVSGRVLQ